MSELSGIDRLDSSDLSGLVSSVRQVLAHPGWQQMRRFLAAKQHTQVETALRRPSGNASADGYALQQSYAAGYARGLRDADLIGEDIIERAQAALARHQQAADAAQEA